MVGTLTQGDIAGKNGWCAAQRTDKTDGSSTSPTFLVQAFKESEEAVIPGGREPEKGAGRMMENRRQAARQTAGWSGFCHVEGESASGWRDCRVLDISTLGVGIKMQHSHPSDLMGRRVSIELPAVGDAVNIRFEGEVMNVAEAALPGTFRIGIAFNQLSVTERAILEVLSNVAQEQRALSLA